MSSEQFSKDEKLILESMFKGWKIGLCECDRNYSLDDEVSFLNSNSDNQHLIKVVFDESYEGTNDFRYNIDKQDYYEIDSDESDESEEEEEEQYKEKCKNCNTKLCIDTHIYCLTSRTTSDEITICTDCYNDNKEELNKEWFQEDEESSDEEEEGDECEDCGFTFEYNARGQLVCDCDACSDEDSNHPNHISRADMLAMQPKT